MVAGGSAVVVALQALEEVGCFDVELTSCMADGSMILILYWDDIDIVWYCMICIVWWCMKSEKTSWDKNSLQSALKLVGVFLRALESVQFVAANITGTPPGHYSDVAPHHGFLPPVFAAWLQPEDRGMTPGQKQWPRCNRRQEDVLLMQEFNELMQVQNGQLLLTTTNSCHNEAYPNFHMTNCLSQESRSGWNCWAVLGSRKRLVLSAVSTILL